MSVIFQDSNRSVTFDDDEAVYFWRQKSAGFIRDVQVREITLEEPKSSPYTVTLSVSFFAGEWHYARPPVTEYTNMTPCSNLPEPNGVAGGDNPVTDYYEMRLRIARRLRGELLDVPRHVEQNCEAQKYDERLWS